MGRLTAPARAPRASSTEILGVCLLGLVGLGLRALFLSYQADHLAIDSLTVGLMARHILEGQHYAFYWGQAYMGSLEAYVASVLFALLGPGDVALQLAPLLASVGFAAAAYLLARRLGGARAALVTLALLAAGPPVLTLWNVTPRGGYPEMLLFGTLVLLVAAALAREGDDAPARRWVALGFSAGLGFWCHLLTALYLLVAAAYLFGPRPRWLLRRGPWIAAAAFILGSAPLWLYNAIHRLETFTDLHASHSFTLAGNLSIALRANLPKLLGARALSGPQRPLPWLLLAVVVGVPLVALAHVALVAVRRALRRQSAPELMLAALVVVTALAVLLTPYGRSNTQRYWLPVFSALPVLIALWVTRHLPWGGAMGLVGVLGATFVYGHATHEPVLRDDQQVLCRALGRLGIRYAYAPYEVAAPLTYYSGESLVAADLAAEWYPVRERSFRFPTVIAESRIPWLSDTLRLAGVEVEEHAVAGFVAYRPVAIHGAPRRPLDRARWTAAAWPNGTEAWQAQDGTLQTAWSSGQPQRSGMWFRVDLGVEVPVSGVTLHLGPFTGDFPRVVAVAVSTDGARWETVAVTRGYFRPGVRVDGESFRLHPQFFLRDFPSVRSPRNSPEVRFAPVPARFARISLPLSPDGELTTGSPWSIAELEVFVATAPDARESR
jgi:hypothetical protein